MKQFAEQLDSVFTTKIELKDKDFEQEIDNFVILNIQIYPLLNIVDGHEKLVSLNEIDKIINNLDIRKAPGINEINNELIKRIKLDFTKFFHFFLNTCMYFGIKLVSQKI